MASISASLASQTDFSGVQLDCPQRTGRVDPLAENLWVLLCHSFFLFSQMVSWRSFAGDFTDFDRAVFRKDFRAAKPKSLPDDHPHP